MQVRVIFNVVIIIPPEFQTHCDCPQQALEHPYLRELHDDKSEPVAREKFNSDFEHELEGKKLTKKKLQSMMYDQSLIFSYELAHQSSAAMRRRDTS